MLSEREKVKEGREVNEDSRMKESQKKRHERKMRRKCEERTEGQTDVFFAALRATILFSLDFGGFVLCPTRTHHLNTPLML